MVERDRMSISPEEIAVKRFFDASGGTYGSPRILEDLRDDGWRVSKKTVEASMRRQNLVARPKKKPRRALTKADKTIPRFSVRSQGGPCSA